MVAATAALMVLVALIGKSGMSRDDVAQTQQSDVGVSGGPLGVTRSYLIAEFEKPRNGGYSFSQRKGDPDSYIALSDDPAAGFNNGIELIGPESSLREIHLFAILGQSYEQRVASIALLGSGIGIVDSRNGGDVFEWIESELAKFLPGSPDRTFKASQQFGTKTYELIWDSKPGGNRLTIRIAPLSR